MCCARRGDPHLTGAPLSGRGPAGVAPGAVGAVGRSQAGKASGAEALTLEGEWAATPGSAPPMRRPRAGERAAARGHRLGPGADLGRLASLRCGPGSACALGPGGLLISGDEVGAAGWARGPGQGIWGEQRRPAGFPAGPAGWWWPSGRGGGPMTALCGRRSASWRAAAMLFVSTVAFSPATPIGCGRCWRNSSGGLLEVVPGRVALSPSASCGGKPFFGLPGQSGGGGDHGRLQAALAALQHLEGARWNCCRG